MESQRTASRRQQKWYVVPFLGSATDGNPETIDFESLCPANKRVEMTTRFEKLCFIEGEYRRLCEKIWQLKPIDGTPKHEPATPYFYGSCPRRFAARGRWGRSAGFGVSGLPRSDPKS